MSVEFKLLADATATDLNSSSVAVYLPDGSTVGARSLTPLGSSGVGNACDAFPFSTTGGLCNSDVCWDASFSVAGFAKMKLSGKNSSGGTKTLVTSVWLSDPSVATQPISGTVTANAGTGTFTTDGSAHTQPVSGTVTANAGSGTLAVSCSGCSGGGGTTSLGTSDAQRLDLTWWGIWALVGFCFVAVAAYWWRGAWGLEGKWGRG